MHRIAYRPSRHFSLDAPPSLLLECLCCPASRGSVCLLFGLVWCFITFLLRLVVFFAFFHPLHPNRQVGPAWPGFWCFLASSERAGCSANDSCMSHLSFCLSSFFASLPSTPLRPSPPSVSAVSASPRRPRFASPRPPAVSLPARARDLSRVSRIANR